MERYEETKNFLLVAFLFLFTPFVLYSLRHLDDNTFSSWSWVFSDVNLGRIYLYLLLGIVISFFLSRIPGLENHHFLVLFSLSFLTVIPLWREPESILDASRYFLQAKHLELYGIAGFLREWGKEITVWTDMPVGPFCYGIIFKYFGESRIFVQLFNTLIFSSTVLVTCLIGNELWDEEKGFYAGLLLLGIPYLTTQVPLMLVDILSMFLLSLSIFTFIKALKKGGPVWITLSAFVIFLTVFAKYSTWMMLTVLPVIAVVLKSEEWGVVLRRSASVAVMASLLCIVALFAKQDVVLEQINLLRAYQWPGLRRWGESFTSTFLFQAHPFISFFAMYAAYVAIKKRDKRFLMSVWFVAFILILNVKRIRYIVPLFPLFTLMSSYGLCEIKDKNLKRFIGLGIVASSLVILYGAYIPFLSKGSTVNLKNAGHYLDTLDCDEVGVYALPQINSTGNTDAAIPILDLFTGKRLLYLRDSPVHTPKTVKTSSLRFTWEFKNPRFYSGNGKRKKLPAAVISSEEIKKPPEEIVDRINSPEILEQFTVSSGVFLYKTLVTVFGKECRSPDEVVSPFGKK